MNFTQLHQQPSPLLICNVWDAASATIAEKLGFKAIGTSSAAIAKLLGYEDGENMPFSELFNMVRKIASCTNLPLTVDIEAGYSRDEQEIIGHIVRLAKLGVVGINIEDSIVNKERELVDTEGFALLVEKITTELKSRHLDVFINVRTDTFILGINEVLNTSIARIQRYEKAGANGIFVPCLTNESDISAIVNSTSLPVNVMCMPELASFKRLAELGVKRISMGNFLFEHLNTHFESVLGGIIKQQSFESIF